MYTLDHHKHFTLTLYRKHGACEAQRQQKLSTALHTSNFLLEVDKHLFLKKVQRLSPCLTITCSLTAQISDSTPRFLNTVPETLCCWLLSSCIFPLWDSYICFPHTCLRENRQRLKKIVLVYFTVNYKYWLFASSHLLMMSTAAFTFSLSLLKVWIIITEASTASSSNRWQFKWKTLSLICVTQSLRLNDNKTFSIPL